MAKRSEARDTQQAGFLDMLIPYLIWATAIATVERKHTAPFIITLRAHQRSEMNGQHRRFAHKKTDNRKRRGTPRGC